MKYQLIERNHNLRNPNGVGIKVRYTFEAKNMDEAREKLTDMKRTNPRIVQPTAGRHIEFQIIPAKYGV